ncbi:MAG: PAS domain S-box protein [Thermomicrobiales bacterium]
MNSSQKLRLLIVEDDAIDFRRLREALREHRPDRYFLKHASNMEQASATLSEERFDLVLLDISLPDSSGVEELEKVQRMAPDSLIILLGNGRDMETGFAAVSAGAEDFLVKDDLKADRLEQAIEYAVARRQYQQNANSDGAVLRELFDQIGELAVVVDSTGNLRAGHDNLRRVLDHQPDQLYFRTWIGLLHPEDQAEARRVWNRLLIDPGEPQGLVARFPRPDGDWSEFDLTLANRIDEPSIGGVLITGSNIARVVAYESVARQFSDVSRVMLASPEPDSAVNAIFASIGSSFSVDEIRLFEYVDSELNGTMEAAERYAWSSWEGGPGRLSPVVNRALVDAGIYAQLGDEARRNPASGMIQLTPRRSAGETNFLAEPLMLVPIYTRNMLWGVVMVVMPAGPPEWSDEQCMALKATVDAVGAIVCRPTVAVDPSGGFDRTTRILDRVKGGVLLYDRSGNLTYANPAVQEITGRSAGEFFESQRFLLGSESARNIDQTFEHSDGRVVHATLDITPLEDGGVISIYDTSSIRRAAQIMHANQARLRSIVETAIEGILTLDAQGQVESLNPAAEQMFRASSSEAVGKHLVDLIPEHFTGDDEHQYLHDYFDTLPGGAEDEVHELYAVRTDGSAFPIEMNLRHYDHRNRRKFIASVRDVSKQKAAEERVARQLWQLRALHRVDRALSASRDQQVILDVAADQIIMTPDIDIAIIRSFSDVSQELTLRSERGLAASESVAPIVRPGHGLAGRSAFDRQPVVLEHADDSLVWEGETPAFGKGSPVAGLAIPLIVSSQLKGTIEVYGRDREQISDETVGFLNSLSYQVANAIDETDLFSALVRSKQLPESAYESTLEGWSRALEMRRVDTEGHAMRVSQMAVELGREMRLEGEDLKSLRRGALLHDIGKIGIPDAVLHKPGTLDEDDWAMIREVPKHAMDLLSGLPFLRDASSVPYFHHEKWDGTGYPNGLVGEAIPLAARIFAVVDVWDTLISDRPYRKALSREQAIEEILSQSGTSFDPRVVDAFLRIIEERDDEDAGRHDVQISESPVPVVTQPETDE